MRFFVLLFCVALSLSGCTQEPVWRFIPQKVKADIPLGDTLLTLIQYRYNERQHPFLLHLHHNEQTADSTLHDYLSKQGGSALTLANNQQRLVSFSLNGKRYLFDPNRMFTLAGIHQSLSLLSVNQPGAVKAISKLADTLLSLIPSQDPIIAMHNNTDGAYSLFDYTAKGPYAGETDSFFRNPAMDPDDFVLTTNRPLFDALQQRGINTVLQHNDKSTNDGSLGYFMGNRQRYYINIEAQHGHGREQALMLQAVMEHLQVQ